MEVGQIVSEPGPPSRYCDAIIHHKLSTHRDNLRRTTDRPTGCLFPRAASLYASSLSLSLSSARSSHLPASALHDAFTCNAYERTKARCHLRARANATKPSLERRRNRFESVAAISPSTISTAAMDFMPETTLLHKRGISIAATAELC